MKKWVVSVLSTDYDLHKERQTTIQLLRSKGFEPLAFEEPGYVKTLGEHSHQVCLDAINEADLCILIINKRYGGELYGEGGVSITEKEYETAVSQGKPIIVFVNQQAWDAKYKWSKAVKELVAKGVSEENAREAIDYEHVESIRVFDFIERIHRAPKDNFIHFFSSTEELEKKIVPSLESLSRAFILKVVDKQAEKVKQMKTSVALEISLGDVFRKDLYVEAPYSVSSGEENDKELIDLIVENQYSAKPTLLLGDLGMGKSTAICGAFLNHVRHILDRDTALCIPLFMSLSGKGQDFIFDLDKYMSDAFNDYGKDIYPSLTYTGLAFCFYFDSFDELCSNMQNVDFRAFFEPLKKYSFVMACRSHVAEEYISVYEGSLFNTIIRLKKWEDPLVRKFVIATVKDDLKRKLILSKIDTEEFAFIKESPLYVTLFIWVCQKGNYREINSIRGDTDLLSLFMTRISMREIFKRETQKSGEKLSYVTLLELWKSAAWELYHGGATDVEDLYETVNVDEKYRSVFLAPFVISPLQIVSRIFHQHLGDYLVAKYCVDAMEKGINEISDTLSVVIKPEVNRMVREILNLSKRQTAKKCIRNMSIAFNAFSNGSSKHLQIQSNIAYYLTRISHDKCIDEISTAQEMIVLKNPHPTVMLSIYFGFVKSGKMDYEEKLFNKLLENEFSDFNRGYHLTYYSDQKDVPGKGLPYRDKGGEWPKTYQALKRHLILDDEKYVFLRRIELLTIQQLMEKRNNNDYLSKDEVQLIQSHIESDVYPSPLFEKNVKRQWEALKKSIEGLASE